jgi:hypothetical protein
MWRPSIHSGISKILRREGYKNIVARKSGISVAPLSAASYKIIVTSFLNFVEMAGIGPYRTSTPLLFFSQNSLRNHFAHFSKIKQSFSIPDASQEVGLLLINHQKTKSLTLRRAILFFCGDGGNRTRVQIWY